MITYYNPQVLHSLDKCQKWKTNWHLSTSQYQSYKLLRNYLPFMKGAPEEAMPRLTLVVAGFLRQWYNLHIVYTFKKIFCWMFV